VACTGARMRRELKAEACLGITLVGKVVLGVVAGYRVPLCFGGMQDPGREWVVNWWLWYCDLGALLGVCVCVCDMPEKGTLLYLVAKARCAIEHASAFRMKRRAGHIVDRLRYDSAVRFGSVWVC
jgi:hypothetical protein